MGRKSKKTFSMSDIKASIATSLRTNQTEDMLDWVVQNQIQTEDGYTMEFEQRKYLKDVINDKGGPDGKGGKLVLLASAQIGKSVTAYLKGIMACMYDNMNVVYSLPTQDMSDTLTESKLNRIIENNPVIRNATKSSNFRRKVINDRMMYLVYTHGSASAIAFSADIAILDEASRSNVNYLHNLKSRMLNSPYQYEWVISNPNVTDDYTHRLFKLSTQNHWAVQHKSGCGKWQIFDFDKNMDEDRLIFQCSHCKGELTPEDRVQGEWVKKYRDRDVSGYWMHQGLRYNVSVKEMLYERDKNPHAYANMYLGLPYTASDITIDAETIKEHIIQPLRPKRNIVMGMDVGPRTGHYYVLMSDGVVFKVGNAKDWQAAREIINHYQPEVVCVDNGPELSQAQALQGDYPGKVWRVKYTRNKPEDIVKYEEETNSMQVSRNLYFDEVVHQIPKGTYKFAYNENDPDLKKFIDHWSVMYCTTEIDGSGNPQIVWDSESTENHLAHAFIYANLAWKRLREFAKNYVPFTPEEEKKLIQPIDGFLEDENGNQISWLDL